MMIGSGSVQWSPASMAFANRMNSMVYQPYAVPQQSPQVAKPVDGEYARHTNDGCVTQ